MKPVGILVLVPTRLTLARETRLCIGANLNEFPHRVEIACCLPVVPARNMLAQWAQTIDLDTLPFEPRYLLWLDDDIFFTEKHVRIAIDILEENPTVDMVTAGYSNREAYGRSNALAQHSYGKSIAPMSLTPGELAECSACGFGFVIMRRSLLDRVGPNPFDRLPITSPDEAPLQDIPGRMAEDYSFCKRVLGIGGKIVTERSLVVGHVDVADGLVYYPYLPPKIANGLEPQVWATSDRGPFRMKQRPRDYDMRQLAARPKAVVDETAASNGTTEETEAA